MSVLTMILLFFVSFSQERSDENRMDLGNTEQATAQITDFKLLKVIGKGSFGKVRREEVVCFKLPGCVHVYVVVTVWSVQDQVPSHHVRPCT